MKEKIDCLEEISLDRKVVSFENPAYGVAQKVREEGYEIAGHMGIKQKRPTHNMVGILKEREPFKKKMYGIKWKFNPRAFHLGTIWINHYERGAKEDKKWIMEVYGKKYLPKLTELAEKLSSDYNVEVEVKLAGNFPRRQTYLSDL